MARTGKVLAGAALFIAGCAAPGMLLPKLDQMAAAGKFDEAAALVEGAKEKAYGAKNALLYHLDRGFFLHLAASYEGSNAAFEDAKRVARENYTKSVSKEAGTFLVSDNIRPYAGEEFERAQIHLFSALNYALLGKGESALVEARQVDAFLAKLKTDLGHKNVYTQDAFARYLTGLLYEDMGETNDAHVAFLQALDAYEGYKKSYGVAAPPDLVTDALRTAKALGMADRVAEIQKRWGGEPPAPRPKNAGEVVVLHYQGLIPRKVDQFFELALGKAWGYVDAQRPVGEDAKDVEQARTIFRSLAADKLIRVAFPSFEPTPYHVAGMSVQAAGAHTAHGAAVAQDLGAIAVKNLRDRVARERAKAIARATIKFVLTQKIAAKVEEKKGEGAAWLVKAVLQAASSATELADKRSWAVLPDKIAVARVLLPAGDHTLQMRFSDAAGAPAGERSMDVAVKAGRRTYMLVRTAQ